MGQYQTHSFCSVNNTKLDFRAGIICSIVHGETKSG